MPWVWELVGFVHPDSVKRIVRKVLRIPEIVEPEAFIIIGHPAETPSVPPKKPLEEYCFRDMWGLKL